MKSTKLQQKTLNKQYVPEIILKPQQESYNLLRNTQNQCKLHRKMLNVSNVEDAMIKINQTLTF